MMKNIFRRWKLFYILYNFFHKKELAHNISPYKKLGIKKWYFSPVSSKSFHNITSNNHFKEQNNQQNSSLAKTNIYKSTDAESRQSLIDFQNNGFAIVNNYLSAEQVGAINAEIQNLLDRKIVRYAYINKIMSAIAYSSILRTLGNEKPLIELLASLMQGEPVLFQSINFLMGSEQATHSDSIHMTTFPLGGLLGVWLALDDIEEDNGPLHYYPGSHKLPYYLNKDYNNQGNYLFLGKNNYNAYEQMIQKKIQEQNLEKKRFYAKKGDMLIWHANLFHGGEPHTNKNKTRRSMVLHYFRKQSVCYHEITQRPALIKAFTQR